MCNCDGDKMTEADLGRAARSLRQAIECLIDEKIMEFSIDPEKEGLYSRAIEGERIDVERCIMDLFSDPV